MTAVDKTSAALDAALEMTFPASDPISVYVPENKPERDEPSRNDSRAFGAKSLA